MAPPPVFRGQSILGNLPLALSSPLDLFAEAWRKHGDVCEVDLGFISVVALYRPEHFRHVFQTEHHRYAKSGPFWDAVGRLFGNGLPISSGDLWLRQRRLMQPHFHKKNLDGLKTALAVAIERAIIWPDIGAAWKTINIKERLVDVTVRATAESLLGSEIEPQRLTRLVKDIDRAQTLMLTSVIFGFTPKWVPRVWNIPYDRAIERTHALIRQLLDLRRMQSTQRDDILGVLLAATTPAGDMSEEQLIDEVTSLFVAGFETTASGLGWITHFLTESQERINQYYAAIISGDEDFTRNFIKESLRLGPPIWWLHRTAVRADTIGGYDIKPGTIVSPIIYHMHRNPEIWEEPETFDPSRFCSERESQRPRMSWIPFGGGPRVCIGSEIALIESQIIFDAVLRRYEIRPCSSPAFKPNVGNVGMAYSPSNVAIDIRLR